MKELFPLEYDDYTSAYYECQIPVEEVSDTYFILLITKKGHFKTKLYFFTSMNTKIIFTLKV